LTWLWRLLQAKGWVPDTLSPPPVLDTDTLWVILSGMLGIAGLRSFDKAQRPPRPRMWEGQKVGEKGKQWMAGFLRKPKLRSGPNGAFTPLG